jgi:hypothetical protein
MKWEQTKLFIPEHESVDAVTPIIVSASRRCDLPAFQSEKFLKDLEREYTVVKNPFSGNAGYVSFSKTRLFVFWTKNPKPFLPVLKKLMEQGINLYFQFTLNDYDTERYEKGLPPLSERITTFRQLSQMIGAEKVIWRFDPLMVTDQIPLQVLFGRIEKIAVQLTGYTRQLVFSFADIVGYRSVSQNLQKLDVHYRDFDNWMMFEAANYLSDLGKKCGLRVSTCSEEIDFNGLGISHNRCIDDRLIARLFPNDQQLMNFIFGQNPVSDNNPNYTKIRDRGQRKTCGCIMSKDIGEYGDCKYGCNYCYARRNV